MNSGEPLEMSRAEWAAFLGLPVLTISAYLFHSDGQSGWAALLFFYIYFPLHVLTALSAGVFFAIKHRQQRAVARVWLWLIGSPVLVFVVAIVLFQFLPGVNDGP